MKKKEKGSDSNIDLVRRGISEKGFGDAEDGVFGSWLDTPPPGHGSRAQGCGGGRALSKKLGGEHHGLDLIGLREAERAREMERTWLHHGGSRDDRSSMSILFPMATDDESSTSMIWWRKRPGEEEEEEEEEERDKKKKKKKKKKRDENQIGKKRRRKR
ncbi:hypothetical protein ACLB2K_022056 [Fragaria x ananassa]